MTSGILFHHRIEWNRQARDASLDYENIAWMKVCNISIHMYMGRVTGLVGNVPFRIEWNRQGRDSSLTIHYMDKGVSYQHW